MPSEEGRYVATPELMRSLIDENTIGLAAVGGMPLPLGMPAAAAAAAAAHHLHERGSGRLPMLPCCGFQHNGRPTHASFSLLNPHLLILAAHLLLCACSWGAAV